MPRILPRLLDKISSQQPEPWLPFKLPRQKKKSLHKPSLPRPSFHPTHHARSILLADTLPNPITSSRDYVQHKSLPPRVRVVKRAKARLGEYDRPRQMSDEERAWWASPYLRMLASPIRKCVITNRYLPSDFLIRLGPMRLHPHVSSTPESQPQPHSKHDTPSVPATFIPDGLLHPKFTGRRSGRATYILCSRHAVDPTRVLNGVRTHALLAAQIAHHLRLRVLQELELLVDQLAFLCARRGTVAGPRVLRRLTRDEWGDIRTTSVIPHAHAVAVLVVPPLNKDPVTKERPEARMSALPTAEEVAGVGGSTPPPPKTLFPLSTFHPTSTPSPNYSALDDTLPQAQVPLYNCVAMFPAREQRAALSGLLVRLLDIERSTRYRHEEDETVVGGGRERQKASHAFLLCSDRETAKRGDAAAVAIALWRVKMFEAAGWEEESASNSGWLIDPHPP